MYIRLFLCYAGRFLNVGSRFGRVCLGDFGGGKEMVRNL